MLKKSLFSVTFFALMFLAELASAKTVAVGTTSTEFNVRNGSATYTVPILVSPGRAGMQPDMSLSYSSGGGTGVFGKGWSLGGLTAIHRCTKNFAQDGEVGGINFDANDEYCLDGQRLVAVNGVNGASGTEYRTEIDSYSQIFSYGGNGTNPDYWIVKTKSGLVQTFGGGNASLEFPKGVTSWSIREINDTSGNNPITFTYIIDNYTQYLSRIDYIGGEVEFKYEDMTPKNPISKVYC